MTNTKSWRLVALLAALALSACASTTSHGVMAADEPTYVASVEVIKHDASDVFADRLHEAVLKAATYYGTTGRPIAITIDLDKVHYKNVLKAMVIGDNSYTKGHVTVRDQTSGEQLGAFRFEVGAERPSAGGTGLGIAMFVLEAIDPTGAVGAADIVGNAASADINRGGAASAMCANFAAEALRQTFGDAKTRAAKSAKRNQPNAGT